MFLRVKLQIYSEKVLGVSGLSKKKKKEHIIKAPKVVSSYIHDKLRSSSRILREERVVVFRVARRLAPLFSGLILVFGLTTMILVFYLYVSGQIIEILNVKSVTVAVLMLTGIINFVSGLLLMGREKT